MSGVVKIPAYTDEKKVSSKDYLTNIFKHPGERSLQYVHDLMPFVDWFPHYITNWDWILSDFITGVTVAIVLVPQSMSYAKLANLSPEFGLYSAFVGVCFYFIFATSREICIGPVAVLSTVVGKVVERIQNEYGDEYSGPEIATTLALICGGIVLGIGLLRLGFIVELISLPAILAFTTGSAFNIASGQLAGLMGYSKKAGKHSSTYETLIAFLKHLPDTTVDAAFGLTGLFILYLWQFVCERLVKKYERQNEPKKRLAMIYLLNIRTAIVIIVSTCISYGVLKDRSRSSKMPYSIIGKIPSGLQHVHNFHPPAKLAGRLASDIPIATIVMVLEHISISKSFARINGYRVNPNQEFVAIGFTNMIGTFFSAYPATGSFSRTALSAKCGVKTPFKSAFSGACVLLAIYCFTGGFFYIPNATLCAIIIHCVTGLLANYKLTTKLYMFSPVDFIIFLVGVFITVFATIEDGIYWACCASCAQLLWRMCITNGTFLGRVKVGVVKNPVIVSSKRLASISGTSTGHETVDVTEISEEYSVNNAKHDDLTKAVDIETAESLASASAIKGFIYKWTPLPSERLNPSFIHTSYINNRVHVEAPPDGVLIYRLTESFIYTNCSRQIDQIIYKIRKDYRPFNSNRERLWSEYSYSEDNFISKYIAPKLRVSNPFKKSSTSPANASTSSDEDLAYDSGKLEYNPNADAVKPILRVLHLDLSQVIAVDATSVQALMDLKDTVNNYVGKDWQLHFSGIINPWVTRSIINAGLAGNMDRQGDALIKGYLHDNVGDWIKWGKQKVTKSVQREEEQEQSGDDHEGDLEVGETRYPGELEIGVNEDGSVYPLHSTNYPNIFTEIPSYSEYD